MLIRRQILGGVAALVVLVGSISCATTRPRPLFSGSNCGMPSQLSSLVFEASAPEVAAALRAALEGREWQAQQRDESQLESLYQRTVVAPEATKWLPGPHKQYLVVIVTPNDSGQSTVAFMMSEYEPRADEGTSFALTAPEKFIDDFEGLVQEVRGTLRVTAASSAITD